MKLRLEYSLVGSNIESKDPISKNYNYWIIIESMYVLYLYPAAYPCCLLGGALLPSSCSGPNWYILPSHNSIPSSRPSHFTSLGISLEVILPTFVSWRKLTTAGIAYSSWKRSLMDGACGYLHMQAFPTAFHSNFICPDQARHFTKRWCLVCLSLLPHYH